jgi:hypothetical protein
VRNCSRRRSLNNDVIIAGFPSIVADEYIRTAEYLAVPGVTSELAVSGNGGLKVTFIPQPLAARTTKAKMAISRNERICAVTMSIELLEMLYGTRRL